MNIFIVAAVFAVGLTVLPADTSAADFGPENPFYSASSLPFQAPPYNKIKDTDYQPAIEAGMADQLKEIKAIADNPAPPTFQNTFIPMEKSGELLERSTAVFFCVSSANTNPTLQKTRAAIAPKLAAHNDAIYLDDKLFQRVKAIYDQRQSLKLDPESLRLVEVEYDKFIHAGANLSEADKTQLKKLNEELASLSNEFSTKLLAATKDGAYVTTDKAALTGFSDARLAAAAEAAKGRKVEGYVIPLQNTTQQPDLVSLTNRSTREALFNDSWNRAEKGDANDTRDIISKIAQLRAQKAKLLGYQDFAAWKLEDQMAKTPEAALKFMDELVPAPPPKRRSRLLISRPSSTRKRAASKSSPGTGTSTPSRSAKRSTISTKRRSSLTSSSTTYCRTASSTPPISSTASPSRSAKIFRPMRRRCASSKSSTPTAARSRSSIATTSSATTSKAAPG